MFYSLINAFRQFTFFSRLNWAIKKGYVYLDHLLVYKYDKANTQSYMINFKSNRFTFRSEQLGNPFEKLPINWIVNSVGRTFPIMGAL